MENMKVTNPLNPTSSFPVSDPHQFFTVRHPPSKIHRYCKTSRLMLIIVKKINFFKNEVKYPILEKPPQQQLPKLYNCLSMTNVIRKLAIF